MGIADIQSGGAEVRTYIRARNTSWAIGARVTPILYPHVSGVVVSKTRMPRYELVRVALDKPHQGEVLYIGSDLVEVTK